MSNSLKQTLPAALLDLDMDFALKMFTKEKYSGFMESLCQKHSDVLSDMRALISSGDGWQDEMKDIAGVMADMAKKRVQKKFILNRSREEMDLNYALTCFIFPMLMTIGNDEIKQACIIISKEWGVVFPKAANIQATTIEDIQTGFKRRIFGIPIE